MVSAAGGGELVNRFDNLFFELGWRTPGSRELEPVLCTLPEVLGPWDYTYKRFSAAHDRALAKRFLAAGWIMLFHEVPPGKHLAWKMILARRP